MAFPCSAPALLVLTGLTILSNATLAQEATPPPDDSEYIIFIIYTSGSMLNDVWPMMLKKVEETLNLYPKVKGFQVMNDEGAYIFTGDRGKWIADTPAQRRAVVERCAPGMLSRIPARSRASSRLFVPIRTRTRRLACTCSVTSSRQRNGGTFVSLAEPERSRTR